MRTIGFIKSYYEKKGFTIKHLYMNCVYDYNYIQISQ